MKKPSPTHALPVAILLACMLVSLMGQTLEPDARLSSVRSSHPGPSQEPSPKPDIEPAFPPGLIKFTEADLNQVLDVYQELSGRTVIRPGALPQVRVTVRSQTELSLAETIEALDSALALNSIVMIPMGDKFVKAVPMQQASKEAAPMFEGSAEDLPDAGTYVVFPLRARHVKPSELAMALQPFANNPQSILAMDDARLVVLRDLAGNVRQMARVAEMIDRPTGGVPVREGRRGLLFLLGSLAGLGLARRLLRGSAWRATWIAWGSGVVLGYIAMNLRHAGAGGPEAPTYPWSAEAAGLLFVVLVPWLYRLFRKWTGRELTDADRGTGASGLRAWLTGEQVIALLAVSVLASHGLGYAFWFTLIVGGLVLAAYPLGNTLLAMRRRRRARSAEVERSLAMLRSGLLTPREFGHRVAAIYGAGETGGSTSDLKYEI